MKLILTKKKKMKKNKKKKKKENKNKKEEKKNKKIIIENNLDKKEKEEKDEIENNSDEEDEKKNEIEIIEPEEKNDCFGFENEKNNENYTDLEKELFINSNLDKSNLFMIYKNLNKRISILYSRRLILTLLKISLNNNEEKNLEMFVESASKEDLYNIIKLLVHEGFFINSLELGSDLLLSIKKLILNLNSSKNPKNQEIITYFIHKCLEEIKYVNESTSFSFKTNYSNESDISEKPYIFFNIWFLMILSDAQENSCIENLHKNCINIFKKQQRIEMVCIRYNNILLSKCFINIE